MHAQTGQNGRVVSITTIASWSGRNEGRSTGLLVAGHSEELSRERLNELLYDSNPDAMDSRYRDDERGITSANVAYEERTC